MAPAPSPTFESRSAVERRVTAAKLVIGGLATGLSLSYLLTAAPSYRYRLEIIAALFAVWTLVTAALGRWMRADKPGASLLPVASTLLDVLVAALSEVALNHGMALSFINSPVIGMYFLVICLAALRKHPPTVYAATFASVVLHAVVGALAVATLRPPYHVFLTTPTGLSMYWSHGDMIIVSVSLLAFGWAIASATTRLLQEERLYDAAFDDLPDPLLLLDAEHVIVRANQAARDQLAADDLVGRRFDDWLQGPLHLIDDAPHRTEYRAVLRCGDEDRWMSIRITPLTLGKRRLWNTSLRDITDKVRLEEQLTRSQRIHTVARLAHSLSHDMNNIMGGVFGAVSLARHTLQRAAGDEAQAMERYLSTVEDCGRTAADILQRLSSLSETTLVTTHEIALPAFLESLCEMAKPSLPPHIHIAARCADADLTIRGDKTTLSQALWNLVVNARDALGDREGRIEISARRCTKADLPALAGLSSREDDYVAIEVRDDGPGIPPEDQVRVFDPFFTTKQEGRGTGIGLTMVYNAAVAHGGTATVRSQPGSGTVFCLYLESNRESLLPVDA